MSEFIQGLGQVLKNHVYYARDKGSILSAQNLQSIANNYNRNYSTDKRYKITVLASSIGTTPTAIISYRGVKYHFNGSTITN